VRASPFLLLPGKELVLLGAAALRPALLEAALLPEVPLDDAVLEAGRLAVFVAALDPPLEAVLEAPPLEAVLEAPLDAPPLEDALLEAPLDAALEAPPRLEADLEEPPREEEEPPLLATLSRVLLLADAKPRPELFEAVLLPPRLEDFDAVLEPPRDEEPALEEPPRLDEVLDAVFLAATFFAAAFLGADFLAAAFLGAAFLAAPFEEDLPPELFEAPFLAAAFLVDFAMLLMGFVRG
jgi:hypothetical protein